MQVLWKKLCHRETGQARAELSRAIDWQQQEEEEAARV
jgi:hypothetical protein